MPLDASGNYRHNHESAKMHSEIAGKSYDTGKDQGHEDSGNAVEIHSHGDGSFHTMHKGEKVEHETLGHALIHAAKAHMADGQKHFHAHHDGETVHSHSTSGEEVDSRDGEDAKAAHEHMDEAMGDGDGNEHGEPDGDEAPEMAGKGLSGLY